MPKYYSFRHVGSIADIGGLKKNGDGLWQHNATFQKLDGAQFIGATRRLARYALFVTVQGGVLRTARRVSDKVRSFLNTGLDGAQNAEKASI